VFSHQKITFIISKELEFLAGWGFALSWHQWGFSYPDFSLHAVFKTWLSTD